MTLLLASRKREPERPASSQKKARLPGERQIATSGKGSAIYQACLLAISQYKGKVRAGSGKVAVLYQGDSRRGKVWKDLQLRQEAFLKRMGFQVPYELLTDALRRETIPVAVDDQRHNLSRLLEQGDKRFQEGEVDDLWDALSALWVSNNDKLFLYVGASKEPKTVFKEVELPLLTIRAGKLPELQKSWSTKHRRQ
jgi:hypothetical protein